MMKIAASGNSTSTLRKSAARFPQRGGPRARNVVDRVVGDEPEGADRLGNSRRPNRGAESQAVPETITCGEKAARGDTNAAAKCLFVDGEPIRVRRHLDP